MASVAFLGLGVMGYPMAAHLKNKGGHDVTVYNRTTAKAEQWVAQHGGHLALTPRQAAEGKDFVFCCVGNDDDLRSVTIGADGAFQSMKKGSIFIDNTTASAEVARELGAKAAASDFEFLDAPCAALPSEQVFPGRLHPAPHGGNDTHSCDHNSAHGVFLFCGWH